LEVKKYLKHAAKITSHKIGIKSIREKGSLFNKEVIAKYMNIKK
jgi:hypothetical protein